jgi:hypothetical protein
MPLELPNLDDRTYNDLVAEGLSLIPTYAPEWTNHNPADPGITLIELFAYLSEILIYRLNRVTNANKQAFLSLINGVEWKQAHPNPLDEAMLNEEIRKAVLSLRRSDRAVTCEDFEALALAADSRIRRVCCVPRRNLEAGADDSPGHVSVIVLPADQELIQNVEDYLEPRRLLTTQVHIVAPRYLQIGVQITLVLKSDAQEDVVRNQAVNELQTFFSPYHGGDGKGWQFGRDVYVSEIYELLDKLPGVDYVKKTENFDEIKVDPADRGRRKVIVQEQIIGGQRVLQEHLIAIEVQLDELINPQINPSEISIESPVKPHLR